MGNAERRSARFDWRAAGLRYYAYSFHLRQLHGERIQKVSIDAGFTCPNVDGTVAVGGCVFCDNRSFSPSRRLPGRRRMILDQIDEGIRRIKRRYDCDRFQAYFQPATNTYAPVDRLREVYEAAIEDPRIVGLVIGTRPDCVPDDVLDLLQEFAERLPVSVEYGMQTMHDRSLEWMNRGHGHDAMVDAMERSRGRGFEICAHIMLGLPGESFDDMLASGAEVARLEFDSVKIHNLYCVKNTPLADQVERGEVQLMEFEDYLDVLAAFVERLPEWMVVERISGEAPDDWFVGPAWCLDKPVIRREFLARLESRDTWQGKQFNGSTIGPA
ncbi:MAG: TIGR01212 family radical SAM protein [Planctomycetales bacterium]|nr:TIGR01212 family radical SAM protein [Planctomycetales bacterium]